MHFPTDKAAHTIAFDGPFVHGLERKIAQTANAFAMQDKSTMQEDPNLYRWVLYNLSYVPLLIYCNWSFIDIITVCNEDIDISFVELYWIGELRTAIMAD